METAEKRFWEKVNKTEGCWLWTAKSYKGYGSFLASSNPKRWVRAHRWAYEQLRGPIPSALVLDHLCRNPSCVNPDHLEPVTHQVNILRGVGTSAVSARKEFCKRGHQFTAENTYIWRRMRRCRKCRVIQSGLAKKRKRVTQ